MSLDPRDQALAATFPTERVPLFSAFQPLAVNGNRLLIGRDAYYLEVKRDWLHAIWPCGAPCQSVLHPCGHVRSVVRFAFGRIPSRLIRHFIELARRACPNEVGAVITYNSASDRLSLVPCDTLASTPVRLHYEIPPLAPGELVVADIHSHGQGRAGFSPVDDRDDAGATRIAIVVGRVQDGTPQITTRLCLNGLFIPLPARVSSENLNSVQ